jgi:hypothetical protein
LRAIIGYILSLAAASWQLALVDQTKTNSPFAIELGLVMFVTAIFTFIPWLICISIGSAWRLRNPFYYVGFALLVQVGIIFMLDGPNGLRLVLYDTHFLLDGAVAGFVYWLVAGRLAGRDIVTSDDGRKA